jgi:hypothetical protein
VEKYPYCARPDENEDYLSEKICRCTIKIRKKIVRKTKRVFVYGQLILSLGNGLAPTQAIGLPILPTTPPIMRSIHSNAGLSKKAIIAQVIKDMPAEIVFTKTEMDQLYYLSVKCRNNSISQEELITKISNLRGGNFIDIVAALGLIGARYGHREAYDMPREVRERFEASAVSKLAKNSLKDPILKKEYARIKKSIKEGIHPINVGYNSAFVSSNKVLIKCSKGRYLVEVGDTKVDILGFVARGDYNSVKSFEKLMNKMYDVDLKY